MTDTLSNGRTFVADFAPDIEEVLNARYDHLLPGVGESVVEWAYGRHYVRDGLDLRTRMLVTVGALSALGGHTAPQLAINVRSSLKAGATRREIAEAAWQMSLYGGLPSAINALNTIKETFLQIDREDESQ